MQVFIVSTGVREIGTAGRMYVNQASMPMPFEVHPLEYELLYLRSGRKQFDFRDMPSVELSGGDMIVFHPGEVHGNYEAVQNRSSLDYVLIADPERMDTWTHLSPQERAALSSAMARLPRTPFRATQRVQELFDRIADLAQDEERKLRAACLRAEALMLVMETVEAAQHAGEDMPEDIAEAVAYIRENRSSMPSVGELASLVHLSESRFKQKFKQATGVPPMEYVIRARISAAQEMLAESPVSVARVGEAVGFSSSQHFCVQFKRYVGVTPSQYRRSARGEGPALSAQGFRRNSPASPEVYGTLPEQGE